MEKRISLSYFFHLTFLYYQVYEDAKFMRGETVDVLIQRGATTSHVRVSSAAAIKKITAYSLHLLYRFSLVYRIKKHLAANYVAVTEMKPELYFFPNDPLRNRYSWLTFIRKVLACKEHSCYTETLLLTQNNVLFKRYCYCVRHIYKNGEECFFLQNVNAQRWSMCIKQGCFAMCDLVRLRIATADSDSNCFTKTYSPFHSVIKQTQKRRQLFKKS